MNLPYESATAGDKALTELQRVLGRYGCQAFGTMVDVERGCTIVQFRWRSRTVHLEASWRGYANAWLKAHPWSVRWRCSKQEHERRALEQARVSVCSVLRDWVKGQVTAIEAGVMDFDVAFMPHMLLPSGERLAPHATRLLNGEFAPPALEAAAP